MDHSEQKTVKAQGSGKFARESSKNFLFYTGNFRTFSKFSVFIPPLWMRSFFEII